MVNIGCVECHGKSQGHVVNERNQVKPDRIPHGAEVAGLCSTCHTQGCPKTKRKDDCQSCHHYHALFSPEDKKLQVQKTEDKAERFAALMQRGDAAATASDWKSAREAYAAALKLYPTHPKAANRVAFTTRRLNPQIPGFTLLDQQFDKSTGLPLRVQVTGLPIVMLLVPGGDAEVGDDNKPNAKPQHTVTIAPYYLSKTELTQQAWIQINADNPSVHKGDTLPVNNVSWKDAQQWITKLNAKVPGGGFRLPTEAEWEAVARFSAATGPVTERAWFRPTAATIGEFKELNTYAPHPVATRNADPRGFTDLAGNVWEWCSSLFQPYPYDARDGREDPNAEGLRVIRGGSYADSETYLLPTARHGERPDRRQPFNGLRLARTVPAP